MVESSFLSVSFLASSDCYASRPKHYFHVINHNLCIWTIQSYYCELWANCGGIGNVYRKSNGKLLVKQLTQSKTSQFIWKINAWNVININGIQSWIEDCRAAWNDIQIIHGNCNCLLEANRIRCFMSPMPN